MGTFLVLAWLSVALVAIMIPAKALLEYTFGPRATVTSAIVAFPALIAGVSLAFCFGYVILARRGLGVLVVDGKDLIAQDGTRPLWDDRPDLLHFSFITLLGGSPTEMRVTGACKWLVLGQVLTGRLLEVVVIAVGVTHLLEKGRIW